MDIHIQGDMDGVETAARIRHQMDIPIVFLTAYSDENTLERAKATEPYAYVLQTLQRPRAQNYDRDRPISPFDRKRITAGPRPLRGSVVEERNGRAGARKMPSSRVK